MYLLSNSIQNLLSFPLFGTSCYPPSPSFFQAVTQKFCCFSLWQPFPQGSQSGSLHGNRKDYGTSWLRPQFLSTPFCLTKSLLMALEGLHDSRSTLENTAWNSAFGVLPLVNLSTQNKLFPPVLQILTIRAWSLQSPPWAPSWALLFFPESVTTLYVTFLTSWGGLV